VVFDGFMFKTGFVKIRHLFQPLLWGAHTRNSLYHKTVFPYKQWKEAKNAMFQNNVTNKSHSKCF
jgi:hypothetical protein